MITHSVGTVRYLRPCFQVKVYRRNPETFEPEFVKELVFEHSSEFEAMERLQAHIDALLPEERLTFYGEIVKYHKPYFNQA